MPRSCLFAVTTLATVVGRTATVAFVVEGMNVTLHKETLGARCQTVAGAAPGTYAPCSFETLGPVAIPSVGLEGSI